MVTREDRNSSSTIDLTFLQGDLTETLHSCEVRKDLHHGSDHYPVASVIGLELEQVEPKISRAWKSADPGKVAEVAKAITLDLPTLTTRVEVDEYVKVIMEGLTQIVEASVPEVKPSSKAKNFWNHECTQATTEASERWKAYERNRCDETWEASKLANRIKTKTVRRSRAIYFRNQVHETSLSQKGVFALSKYWRQHSTLPRTLPKFCTLRSDGQVAETFDQKARLLKEALFPLPKAAQLQDIAGTAYPPQLQAPAVISEAEVVSTIRGLKPDKAPGIDGIPNRMLQMVAEPWGKYFPQGSPVSPILYLFFNSPLLERCSRLGLRAVIGGFVDDISILAYGKTTEGNCQTIQRVHRECMAWADTHGATFAPHKYELLHLARRSRRFNMQASVDLPQVSIGPKTELRILGLQIDGKLNWGPHLRRIRTKMETQILGLTRVATSTWGATLNKARQVYSAVVRSAMVYGSNIWRLDQPKPRVE